VTEVETLSEKPVLLDGDVETGAEKDGCREPKDGVADTVRVAT